MDQDYIANKRPEPCKRWGTCDYAAGVSILIHYVAGTKLILSGSRPRLNIKTVFPWYGDSHVKDKTVSRPSYL